LYLFERRIQRRPERKDRIVFKFHLIPVMSKTLGQWPTSYFVALVGTHQTCVSLGSLRPLKIVGPSVTGLQERIQ
jgi:hypothetical protein